VPGDRVAIAMPSSLALLSVLTGTVLAGGVIVCLNPGVLSPHVATHAASLGKILADCGASVCVTDGPLLAALAEAGVPARCRLWNPQEGGRAGPSHRPPHRPSESDLAVIQYTSGSTRSPRGAMITHANVVENLRCIRDRLSIGSDDVLVSWLPFFHDMGLGGFWMSLFIPFRFVVLPTQYFYTGQSCCERSTSGKARSRARRISAMRAAAGSPRSGSPVSTCPRGAVR
jgi:acyl-CoA synthetase (AMP-forming)/AMP-acid ligase II